MNEKISTPSKNFKYRHPKILIIYNENGIPVIDLHKMLKVEAAEWCEYFMKQHKEGYIEFVVGKGLHSKKKPVLKEIVIDMLEKDDRCINHGVVMNNTGRIWARLRP